MVRRRRQTAPQSTPTPIQGQGLIAQPSGQGEDNEPVTKQQLSTATQEFHKFVDKQKQDFFDRIEEKETKTTEIMAIFFSLFTFVSVNITIFPDLATVAAQIRFMSMMGLLLFVFTAFLITLLNGKGKRKNDKSFWTFVICIVVFSSVFYLSTKNSFWETPTGADDSQPNAKPDDQQVEDIQNEAPAENAS